jgi:hypothetical protein
VEGAGANPGEEGNDENDSPDDRKLKALSDILRTGFGTFREVNV